MAQQHQPATPPGQGHDSDHDSNGEPRSGLKKKRIQQACRPCGIKRVKCDGSHPCITCIRSGEVCEYGQPKKRGPPKGSTRGGSKAAKRKAQAQLSAARKDIHQQAAALPVQSTRDYAASTSANAAAGVPLSRPPPSAFGDNDWSRNASLAGMASSNAVASSSRYSQHSTIHGVPQQHYPLPTGGMAGISGTFPPEFKAESYPVSGHASPEGSYRTESHRTTAGSANDGSVGSPSYGVRGSSPGYHPPHSYPSRYDPASASHSTKQRTETFYRGSSSGLGFVRPPPGAADRRLPPLDFSNRSSVSPGNYGRLSGTSDTFESALSGRSGASRSLHKGSGSYARPSLNASTSANATSQLPAAGTAPTSYDAAVEQRLTQVNAGSGSQLPGNATWSSAQGSVPSQPQSISHAVKDDPDRSTGARLPQLSDNNQLLVEGALLQMQRDRARDQNPGLVRKASYTSSDAGALNAGLEDVNLEPLLWVEPGDESRFGVNRTGVSLTKPEIPPLIQERLFTIFWGIVQTIWPALYKPALCLTGFNVIDPEKHPMLHNAACALAAVAWDSGDVGVSEEDTEATQSDWVERTASDLSFSQGASTIGDGTSLRRLSAADLGDIFLARAKYYLLKTNNEPSLETIQSLLFMALREGGNGRASQASAYLSTACRMCIDLGLHRQRDFSSVLGLNFSHAEEQARRRIFWCLYLLDKTSSASLGRPVTLRYEEIDCPLPNIDEADEHETWAECTNNSSLIKDRARSILLRTPVAAMTHLRFGVRLGHICEHIISIYTQVRRPGEDGEIPCTGDGDIGGDDTDGAIPEWEVRLTRLHRMLESWERDLPYRLQFDNPAHRLPNTLMQHLWFQACKVMLHRPYILKRSSRPDLPPSLKICTDAVGSICDILTAYDNNFGMRKLSSTVTYCIFTASTIEIANTTSMDPAIAAEAKRRLRKFMTWLSRMSGTWQSASHHLKILEQLGHGIDADLDGTGLPSHREASGEIKIGESPTAAAGAGVNGEVGVGSSLGMPIVEGAGGAMEGISNEQSTGLTGTTSATGLNMQPSLVSDDLTSLSVPGPIGAPMHLARSRTTYQLAPALHDDLQAQFHAQGQNPGLLYGWPATANSFTSRVHTPNPPPPHTNPAPIFENSTTAGMAPVNPTAYLKLHDTSYWGAMPLASEDALSWANFTSSYIEALNGMTSGAASNPGAIASANTANAAFPTAMQEPTATTSGTQ